MFDAPVISQTEGEAFVSIILYYDSGAQRYSCHPYLSNHEIDDDTLPESHLKKRKSRVASSYEDLIFSPETSRTKYYLKKQTVCILFLFLYYSCSLFFVLPLFDSDPVI